MELGDGASLGTDGARVRDCDLVDWPPAGDRPAQRPEQGRLLGGSPCCGGVGVTGAGGREDAGAHGSSRKDTCVCRHSTGNATHCPVTQRSRRPRAAIVPSGSGAAPRSAAEKSVRSRNCWK